MDNSFTLYLLKESSSIVEICQNADKENDATPQTRVKLRSLAVRKEIMKSDCSKRSCETAVSTICSVSPSMTSTAQADRLKSTAATVHWNIQKRHRKDVEYVRKDGTSNNSTVVERTLRYHLKYHSPSLINDLRKDCLCLSSRWVNNLMKLLEDEEDSCFSNSKAGPLPMNLFPDVMTSLHMDGANQPSQMHNCQIFFIIALQRVKSAMTKQIKPIGHDIFVKTSRKICNIDASEMSDDADESEESELLHFDDQTLPVEVNFSHPLPDEDSGANPETDIFSINDNYVLLDSSVDISGVNGFDSKLYRGLLQGYQPSETFNFEAAKRKMNFPEFSNSYFTCTCEDPIYLYDSSFNKDSQYSWYSWDLDKAVTWADYILNEEYVSPNVYETHVGLYPLVFESGTDPRLTYIGLRLARKFATINGVCYIGGDYPVFRNLVIMQLAWESYFPLEQPGIHPNVIVVPGFLHMAINFEKKLLILLKDSGFAEVIKESSCFLDADELPKFFKGNLPESSMFTIHFAFLTALKRVQKNEYERYCSTLPVNEKILFSEWQTKVENFSYTAKLWFIYERYVKVLVSLKTAVRTENADLLIETMYLMINYFYFTGGVNYVRCLSLSLHSLLRRRALLTVSQWKDESKLLFYNMSSSVLSSVGMDQVQETAIGHYKNYLKENCQLGKQSVLNRNLRTLGSMTGLKRYVDEIDGINEEVDGTKEPRSADNFSKTRFSSLVNCFVNILATKYIFVVPRLPCSLPLRNIHTKIESTADYRTKLNSFLQGDAAYTYYRLLATTERRKFMYTPVKSVYPDFF